jgi:enediyne biosynthesis protein E4
MKFDIKNKRQLMVLVSIITLIAGGYWWYRQQQPKHKATIAFEAPKAPADALFVPVTAAHSGIDFVNRIEEDFKNNIMANSYLYNGGGVGVIDVNNDGLQDLFFVSTQNACKLYLNKGNLQFADITASAGLQTEQGDKTGVCIADVNGDGWQDIYVCRTGLVSNAERSNLLFINNKNNTFTEQAKAFGLDDRGASNHANFFDADNDGDLDCYVLNYPVDFTKVNAVRVVRNNDGTTTRQTGPENFDESDHFYLNNGNGTFTENSKNAGIWNRAMGLSVSVADLNGDNYQDILVGNDYIEPDFLYFNNPKRPGTFQEASATTFRHTSNHTMGTDIADLNSDGLPDIVALDMLAEHPIRQKELMSTMVNDRFNTLVQLGYSKQMMRNVLQINNGDGSFSDVGCLAGMFQTDWSWSPLIQDYDNDGLRDLFITNGYRRDVSNLDYLHFTADSIRRTGGLTQARFPKITQYLDLIPQTPLQNYCYRNLGGLQYENVSTAWGFTELSYANGAVYADLDNDGDLDMVINNIDMVANVYQNRANDLKKGQNWLQIKLKGNSPNTDAIGAKARIVAGGKVQYATLSTIRGFLSSVEPILHVGVGAATQIDRLEIEFPGRLLLVKENIPTNQRLIIQAAEASPGQLTPPANNGSQLFESSAAPAFVHVEDNTQDFNHDRLLPWKVSALGPYLTVGDVDRDGLDDVFVGNGPNASRGLFLQTDSGFKAGSTGVFGADAAVEDGACQFFDADQDNDLDLLVAAGGTAQPTGHDLLMPRLYLNDGKGNFTKNTTALPVNIKESIAAVSAFDIDRDGDLDLVLGGGVVPNAFGMNPRSYLLRNDGSANQPKFTDITAQSPDWEKIGMVRSIQWADLNQDQQPEMIVAGEWMPIQVLQWKDGAMRLTSDQYGLENSHGIWRSLAITDTDGDGDQDIVAGNIGLNTRYRSSAEAPLHLYSKDFDNNGSVESIMTYTENNTEYPLAYRDVLLKQLPGLKKKMVRYADYAFLSLSDIFNANELKSAQKHTCSVLASGVWVNQGGQFKFSPLPDWAQVAPLYSIQCFDVDGDKDNDLVAVGNDYGQQVETGPLDAGNGVVLLNGGNGNFSTLTPLQSGFWAKKEARSLALLKGKTGKTTLLTANNSATLEAHMLRRINQ